MVQGNRTYIERVSALPELGSGTRTLAYELDGLIKRRAELTAALDTEISDCKDRLRKRIVKNWTVAERVKANLGNI